MTLFGVDNQNRYLALFLSVFLSALSFTACVGGGQQENSGEIPFIDTPVGEEGEYDPTSGEPHDPDPDGAGEQCENLDTISISPTSISFGLSEFNHLECQTVAVNPCVSFNAEIDDSSDSQFVLYSQDDAEVTGRLTDQQETLQVCYTRTETGSHTGRVNIVMSSGSATYAYGVPLTGSTVDSLFNITSPTDGQLVWEHDGISQYDSASDSFVLSAAGTVNSDLQSILSDSNVTVEVDGTAQTLTLGDDYSFSTSIAIPSSPDVYPVNFSMETSHGTLTTTKNVIRFYRPDGSLEIRDASGDVVSAVAATDAKNTDSSVLTAGIVIDNLDVSGPRAEHPVEMTLSITSPEGKITKYTGSDWEETTDEVSPINFYVEDFDFGGEEDEEGVSGMCPSSFSDQTTTYCIPLPPTANLGRGTNVLTATLCNEYTDYEAGCVTATTSLVVDNDVPVITVSTPVENTYYDIYGQSGAMVTVTGTLENFVKEEETTAEDGTISTTCLAKLWVNTSISQTAIDLCDYLTIISSEDQNSTSGNSGNIRKASFSLDLNFTGDANGYNKLTLYTNLIYIQVEDSKSHVAYKTRSFQIGSLNESTIKTSSSGATPKLSLTGDLTSGQLGEISQLDGSTIRTPLMLNVTEATVQDPKIIAVVEKILNDNVKFADVVQGGVLPGDEDGDNVEDQGENIDFEAEFDYDEGDNFYDLDYETQKKWIWQNLHASMPQKVRALSRYRTLLALRDEADPGNLENVFFKDECGQSDPNDFETGWNVACDSCGNKLSTALVTYNTLQYIYEGILEDETITNQRVWPTALGNSVDADDTVQGKWKIGSLNLKNDGYIDADVCIVGEGDVVEGCDDVADNNHHEPAFWGHVAAIGLIEKGITGLENDPVLPLIWNVGKVRITFKNVLQIKKEKLSDSTYTNKFIIHEDKIIDGLSGSIQLEPYLECAEYYDEKFGKETPDPVGCIKTDEGYKGEIYPVIIDRTALQGAEAYYHMSEEGNNLFLLDILYSELLKTFKGMVSCMDDELVNPLINPAVFEYPAWVSEDVKVDELSLALDSTDDGMSVTLKEDAEDPQFYFTPNLTEADIVIEDGGLSLKLPMTLGAGDVSTLRLFSLLGSSGADTRANGYMYRDPSAESAEALESLANISKVEDEPYLGLSLGLEEVGNSALHVLFRKGLKSVLELVSQDLVDDLNMQSNYTIGIDKVILGNFGLCGQLAGGLASTDLAVQTFFPYISTFFGDHIATHWDITLDKNSPPTLALLPIEGDDKAVMLQLGLSNVQIDVKSLKEHTETDPPTYEILNSVVKLRLDGLIRIVLYYNNDPSSEDSKILKVYILPFDETPFYVSVINRGYTYDDSEVIGQLTDQILDAAFDIAAKSYELGGVADGSIEIPLPNSAVGFDSMEVVNNIRQEANDECTEGEEPQYYSETSEATKDGDENDDEGGKDGESSSSHPSLSLENIKISTPPSEIFPLDGPCFILNVKPDNDIEEALCDVGIQDIQFGEGYPDIIFDSDNGYLHFSTKLLMEIYDWLAEEVSTE